MGRINTDVNFFVLYIVLRDVLYEMNYIKMNKHFFLKKGKKRIAQHTDARPHVHRSCEPFMTHTVICSRDVSALTTVTDVNILFTFIHIWRDTESNRTISACMCATGHSVRFSILKKLYCYAALKQIRLEINGCCVKWPL